MSKAAAKRKRREARRLLMETELTGAPSASTVKSGTVVMIDEPAEPILPVALRKMWGTALSLKPGPYLTELYIDGRGEEQEAATVIIDSYRFNPVCAVVEVAA